MKTNKNVKYYMTNNDSFAKLYDLILDALGMNDFPAGTFSDDGNVWLELVEALERHSQFGAAGVFLDAVHRVMWGISLNEGESAYNEIIQIVVDELLKDGDAFAAWDNYFACDEAISEIGDDNIPWIEYGDDYCCSVEHYEYLREKMMWKIRYSKKKYASEAANSKNMILEYESAIKKIIPAAESWDEAYWYDERHIYNELMKLYGIDYRKDFAEYGRILLILMSRRGEDSVCDDEEVWFASNIRRLPMSLAKVIWTEETEDKITEMFLRAAEAAEIQANSGNREEYEVRKATEIHPVGVFEYSALRESWLFKLVYEWYSDYHGDDENLRLVRKMLCKVSLL